MGSIPGLGRSPGEGKVYPLQYSCLKNSMDSIVHGVTRSWTRLSDFPFQMNVLESNGTLPSKYISVSAFSWITNCIRAQLCPTLFRPWTIAHQAPLSVGFFRQEYWSGLPFPLPGDLPDPGVRHESLASPALAGMFFTTRATWETPLVM